MAVGQPTFDTRETSLSSAEQVVRQIGAELPYVDRNDNAVKEWVAKSVGPERLQQFGLNPDTFIPNGERETLNLAKEGLAANQSDRSGGLAKDYREKFKESMREAPVETTSQVSIPKAVATATPIFGNQLANSYAEIVGNSLQTGNKANLSAILEVIDYDLPANEAEAIRAMVSAHSRVA